MIGGGGAGVGALFGLGSLFHHHRSFPGRSFRGMGLADSCFSRGSSARFSSSSSSTNSRSRQSGAELRAKRGQSAKGASARVAFARVSTCVVGQSNDDHRRQRQLISDFRLSTDLPQGRKQNSERRGIVDPDRRRLVLPLSRRSSPVITEYFIGGASGRFLVLALIRIVLLPLCYIEMQRTHDIGVLTFWALLLTFFRQCGLCHAGEPSSAERFPTALRSTGTGLSWNIGFAIGGTMPTFVSLFSPAPADLPNMLAIFVFGISVLFLAGALTIPETKNNFK